MQNGEIWKMVANEKQADTADVVQIVPFFLQGLDQSLSKSRFRQLFYPL